MKARQLLFIFLIIGICKPLCAYESPAEFHLPFMYAVAAQDIPPGYEELPVVIGLASIHTAAVMAVDMLNNRTCEGLPDILPNTKLILDTYSNFFLPSIMIPQMMEVAEQNITFTTGFISADTTIPAAVVGNVFDVAMLSFFVADTELSNEWKYPYFSRTAVGSVDLISTIHDTLHYYESIRGAGWTDVAIASEVGTYTNDYATLFIEGDKRIRVLSYQTVLVANSFDVEVDYSIELQEIKNSGARVILCLFVTGNYATFLEQANEFGLIGENYVWIIPSATTEFTFSDPLPLARGTLVSLPYIPDDTPFRECFEETWSNANHAQYPYAGFGPPPTTAFDPWDMIMIAATAIDKLDREGMLDGRYIHPSIWSEAVRASTFPGLEGEVSFKSNGDRIGITSLNYYDPETNSYVVAATHTLGGGLVHVQDVVWYSNTTDVPDLDIREPFNYWSCHDKEERHDPTGKAVVLHTPDGSNVDEIESHYHCDQFIDCQNLSDESDKCSSNFLILFIVFGVITGILMLVAVILTIFVVIFGIILQYRRLKAASPIFLVLLLVTIFVGFSSVFAWFGKPHPVGCGFQPWLLGLPTISMITILCVKNYRIWKIFRYPLKRTKISDMRLAVMWGITMVPALLIVIIWTIVSTPTAEIQEFDGEDHYVCATGGFTGAPGGIIFFSIFVAYSALILITGAVISFLSRNVPAGYNESKLLTISIYNLGFLSVVIIPVFLVLNQYNPFLAWILRTCAILYAFSATMFLQFLPRIFDVVIIDKGRNITKGMISTSGSNNSTLSQLSGPRDY